MSILTKYTQCQRNEWHSGIYSQQIFVGAPSWLYRTVLVSTLFLPAMAWRNKNTAREKSQLLIVHWMVKSAIINKQEMMNKWNSFPSISVKILSEIFRNLCEYFLLMTKIFDRWNVQYIQMHFVAENLVIWVKSAEIH